MKLHEPDFLALSRAIRGWCGIALGADKMYLVRQRLEPVARSLGCHSFAELAALVRQPSAELQVAIIQAITTPETMFFRDEHPFQLLRDEILPQFAADRAAQSPSRPSGPGPALRERLPIRIWCAGVATGQEAYSLAIVIDEFLASPQAGRLTWDDFAITASDVVQPFLARAMQGAYTERELDRGLSAVRRRKYFTQSAEHGRWQVCNRLRGRIAFRQQNLLDPCAHYGPLDLILCRNVLIYFDVDLRRRITADFAAALVPGGYLLLGAMENVFGLSDRFTSLHRGPTLLFRRH